MEWNSIKDSGLPKRKYAGTGEYRTMSVSVNLLVYDGESVWSDTYYFDEEDCLFLHDSITHWIEVDKVPVPVKL